MRISESSGGMFISSWRCFARLRGIQMETCLRGYCTLRQRVSRLVRKTLSFSNKLENHIGAIYIGAIWYFVHHYNVSLPI
nr:MAG: hypothetical protein EDM05_29260 [Leptolyngbya sp. IPPAS B-1204]